jgi:DNA-binding MarR family transcriptional regulator
MPATQGDVIGDTGVPAKEQLIGRIMQAQLRLAHVLAFDRSDPLLTANLTMPQLKVLFVLSLRGGAAGHDLTAAMGVSLATITGIVDRLAAQNLVTRREDPRDRRVRLVELTPSGKELIDSIMIAGEAHQRRILERLTASELETVRAAVELMLSAAATEAAAAPAHGAPAVTVGDVTRAQKG